MPAWSPPPVPTLPTVKGPVAGVAACAACRMTSTGPRPSEPVLDRASCEDLHGRLSGLVILPGHRLGSEDANLICHFAGVGGYGLALEELAGYLALAGTPITARSATT